MSEKLKVIEKLDEIIREESKGGFYDIKICGGNAEDFIRALTVDRDKYEDGCLSKIPGELNDYYMRLVAEAELTGDYKKVTEFCEKYMEAVPKEELLKLEAAFLLNLQGYNTFSQNLLDDVYASRLKEKFAPIYHEFISNEHFKKRQKANAQKKRNPFYNEAIRIARLTWKKYPGASKRGMVNKLYEHFNGGVSIDTLNKWIVKARIQPPKPAKYASFSLVVA